MLQGTGAAAGDLQDGPRLSWRDPAAGSEAMPGAQGTAAAEAAASCRWGERGGGTGLGLGAPQE